MNRIVDFYKTSDMKGGVQVMSDELASILPNTNTLSFLDVAKVFGSSIDPYEYNFFELESSYLIDLYLKHYEKVFNPDFVIKNSIVGTFHKPKCKQVCILQDNNIVGPTILRNRGLYNMISYLKFRRSYTYLQKSTMDNSDVCVAVSNNIAKDYEKEFGIKSEVIYNGIDTKLFSPMDKESLRKKYGIPKDKTVAVSVQKFHPIKGWHVLAHLIKNYPDIYWIVVFTVKSKHSRVKAKNVKLFYTLPREQMAEIYNLADFSIQPSAYESFNLCTAEAMSCGVPAIVSNTGFINDLGKTGLTKYGFVVDKWDDPAKYMEAIKEVRNQGKFKPRSIIVEKFNKDIWGRKWQKLVKSL